MHRKIAIRRLYGNYVSRNLADGQTYAYHIRAELERDGDVIVREQTVELAAGVTESVAFDFDTAPTTTLAIQAPVDTSIILHTNRPSAKEILVGGTAICAPTNVKTAHPIIVKAAKGGHIHGDG